MANTFHFISGKQFQKGQMATLSHTEFSPMTSLGAAAVLKFSVEAFVTNIFSPFSLWPHSKTVFVPLFGLILYRH